MQYHKQGMLMIAILILLTGCSRQQDFDITEAKMENQETAYLKMETESEAETSPTVGVDQETQENFEVAMEEQSVAPEKKYIVQEGDGVMRVDAAVEMPEQGLENVKKLTARCKVWNDADKEQAAKILVPDAAKDAWTIDEQGAWSYQGDMESASIDFGFFYMSTSYDK